MIINAINDNTKAESINNTQGSETSLSVGSFDKTLQAAKGDKSISLDSIFEKAAKKYNVDVNLLKAIAKQESNFQADAVSSCGAQGIMQLMPATAKAMGVQDAMNPEQNIMGGAKLISQLLKKYNGNVKLALAGYNAGIGNVAKYNGIPPFKETQDYIKKVMGYLKQGMDAPDSSFYTTGTNNTKIHNTVIYEGSVPHTEKPDSSLIQSLDDSILSYQEYLDFLDILMSMISEDSWLSL